MSFLSEMERKIVSNRRRSNKSFFCHSKELTFSLFFLLSNLAAQDKLHPLALSLNLAIIEIVKKKLKCPWTQHLLAIDVLVAFPSDQTPEKSQVLELNYLLLKDSAGGSIKYLNQFLKATQFITEVYYLPQVLTIFPFYPSFYSFGAIKIVQKQIEKPLNSKANTNCLVDKTEMFSNRIELMRFQVISICFSGFFAMFIT